MKQMNGWMIISLGVVGVLLNTLFLCDAYRPLSEDYRQVKSKGYESQHAVEKLISSAKGYSNPPQVVDTQTLRSLRDLIVFRTREAGHCRMLVFFESVMSIGLFGALIAFGIGNQRQVPPADPEPSKDKPSKR